MFNWNHTTDLLELVEELATFNTHLVQSEEDLSERFDCCYEDIIREDRLEEDGPAISELFSNYADSLVSDGILHAEQYQNYCYLGKFS